MVAKIACVVEARRDPDLLVIARTGAVQNESFDAAIERLEAYFEAGADIAMLLAADDEQLAAAGAGRRQRERFAAADLPAGAGDDRHPAFERPLTSHHSS
ncbi:isocitrate lyase/phosphoenolpyruvate mutase family protein [Amycolatopsis taiwanensis]|uniref:isocitrate lyase/phosphoenolpyruvate mutase family protein n=1 Tax=Amycolatopsis taiwanensis TaxID=342230 RepID=UPI0004886AFD|nr:isocitrate lyase/phosphoenolpyruvate mutase family protein [Amycolatopsis taiwanensis]